VEEKGKALERTDGVRDLASPVGGVANDSVAGQCAICLDKQINAAFLHGSRCSVLFYPTIGC